MARCRWKTEPDGFRWFLPECWGGVIHGSEGCYCERPTGKAARSVEDRLDRLERAVAELRGQRPVVPRGTVAGSRGGR